MSSETQASRPGYQLSDEELHSVWQVQLDLIRQVQTICEKNDITFNMVGGTMLGAIRHKGYIPWDDDADIGFLREEYEKFREACRTDLDHEKYELQDFRDTPGYRWGYGKLRRKNTEYIRLNQEFMPYSQGIFIDLMPFDNVPDGPLQRKWHFFRCFLFRKTFWSEVGYRNEKNAFYRMLYFFLHLLPEKNVKKQFERFITKGEKYENSRLVRILTFPTPKGCPGYKREWYEQLADYSFEDMKLPGAADYDGYLTCKYGEYMKLPPVAKRKVHPISKLTLPENNL